MCVNVGMYTSGCVHGLSGAPLSTFGEPHPMAVEA